MSEQVTTADDENGEARITDHPYIDNNGPTYMYGVCAHGRCGKSVSEHATMIKADRPGGRRRTVHVRV